MKYSMKQMRDMCGRLDRLRKISSERDDAAAACDAANRRWNKAREQYAKEHAEFVATYGAEYAPMWIDALHGPRATEPIQQEPTNEQ